MKGINEDPDLELQVVATGMHLSPEFGLTYKEIENDGFDIARKVEMLLSADTPTSIVKSSGLGMIGFADMLGELQPDVMVVLGDRFEIFAASSQNIKALNCIAPAEIAKIKAVDTVAPSGIIAHQEKAARKKLIETLEAMTALRILESSVLLSIVAK